MNKINLRQHSKSAWIKTKIFLIAHGIDIIITAILGLATGAMFLWWYPNQRFFVERDPSLSYPLIEGAFSARDSVPIWLVIVLALPVVILILIILWVIAKFIFKLNHDTHRGIHPKTLNIVVVILAYLEAFVMTIFITIFMLRFIGRKRPNFFALCDYHGYGAAIAQGSPYNLTEYFALTTAGVPGDIKNCRGNPNDIKESMMGFPSGHSSIIICGMTFIAVYAIYLFNHYSHKQNMLKGLILLILFLGGIIVAATRPRDYWHDLDDTFFGALLGFLCALFSFILNYSKDKQIGILADEEQTEHDEKINSDPEDVNINMEQTPK